MINIDENSKHFENRSTAEGLSNEEVSLRRSCGLANFSPKKTTKTIAQILRDNILTTFNAFNIAIGICLAAVDAWVHMSYLFIVFLNAAIGTVQEIRAKKSIEKLSLISALKVAAVRGGLETEIPVEELVVGDLTLLAAGNQICADCVVVSGEIEADESLLTGESDPVLKTAGDALLSGSFVTAGKCRAEVHKAGAENFASKLAEETKKHKKPNSELLNSMKKVVGFTGFFIVPLAAALFFESYFLGKGLEDPLAHSVVYTAAALLGLMPKGLVLLISVSLAAGIVMLAKKKILVRELYCIETLARADVLCFDKTGTLTEGKMRVEEVFELEGHNSPVRFDLAIGYFVGAMEAGGESNSTFMALKERFASDFSRAAESKTAFSPHRKWSSASFSELGSFILGAPEILSGSKIDARAKEAQARGGRVMYLCHCPNHVKDGILPNPADISPVAAIVLSDPVRKNAKDTLNYFKNEGVAVKIISGDSPLTISGIAKKAGLENPDVCLDMTNVNSEAEIKAAAAKYSIFGRVAPGQKKSLIRALKSLGHTVAMTGDGVNDVLALREADCSIAMGEGSDAARQVAQFVLLDSDFSAMPEIIGQGRRIINNITRSARVFFVKTLYSALLVAFSLFTLAAFPFLPIQITLINATIEAFPGVVLTLEPNNARFSGKFLGAAIGGALPYAVCILLGFLAVKIISPAANVPETQAQTIAYYITGLLCAFSLVGACRPFTAFRAIVCIMAIAGFVLGAYIWSDFFSLVPLADFGTNSLLLLASLAAACFPLTMLANAITKKLGGVMGKKA
ncbi:MAG: cation-translocating P-type ATPase [Oscillospiraceae bacterium]|nr:cation-translocating P-type ATPase [Oscillospiraceae bacterium]